MHQCYKKNLAHRAKEVLFSHDTARSHCVLGSFCRVTVLCNIINSLVDSNMAVRTSK